MSVPLLEYAAGARAFAVQVVVNLVLGFILFSAGFEPVPHLTPALDAREETNHAQHNV